MKRVLQSLTRVCLIIIFIGLIGKTNIYGRFTQDKANNLILSAREAFKKRDLRKTFELYKNYIDSVEFGPYQRGDYLGEAYYNVGHFYKCGHYVKTEPDSAVKYLDISALAYHNTEAIRMVADTYYYARYGRKDKATAFNYMKRAADEGDPKAAYEVAGIYFKAFTPIVKDSVYIITTFDGARSYKEKDLTYSSSLMKFPEIETDSVKGYYYYEKGLNSGKKLLTSTPLLRDIDFIRAYMDGTYCVKDHNKSWEYLKPYAEVFLPESTFDSYASELLERRKGEADPEYGEILWRIQASYRFGLGTRTNIELADKFLDLAREFGYNHNTN